MAAIAPDHTTAQLKQSAILPPPQNSTQADDSLATSNVNHASAMSNCSIPLPLPAPEGVRQRRLMISMADHYRYKDIPDGQREITADDLLEMGDDCLGLQVHVTTFSDNYGGVICFLKPSRRFFDIEKVYYPDTAKKLMGTRTIFFHSILQLTVIGVDKTEQQRLRKIYMPGEDQRGKQLLMKKIVPHHLLEKDEEEVGVKGSPRPPPPPPNGLSRPSKWVVIDTLDEAFEKAVGVMHGEAVVGVGVQGLRVGRQGALAWLTVATSHIIFLFDVAKMGTAEVLEAGLGELLEGDTILKVLHDCRGLEDLLHHQFSLGLSNVYDTLAAEVCLHMMLHQGRVPFLAQGLSTLLTRHLGLSPDHLRLVPHEEVSDETVWFERPLSPVQCEALARAVMFLPELRLAQIDRLLVDVAQVTQLFLGAYRDKDSTTVNNLEPQVIPAEVQVLGQHARRTTTSALTRHTSHSQGQ